MKTKRTGRPTLPEYKRKTHTAAVKLSAAEIDIVKAKATKAKLSCYEYMRQAILKAKVVTPMTPEQLAAYKAFTSEIHRVGLNLNAIARRANSGVPGNYALDIDRLMSELTGIKNDFLKQLTQ